MSIPKVSIVIPAYNHERYVGEAIQSALDQTFLDFELIIINDGSTDRTEDEILRFKDKRIRYYFQENRGLSATLNRGIELARGEYFSFLPSDDLYEREKVEIQINEFQAGGDDLGILFSKQTVIDAQGKELSEDPILDWFNVPYRNKEEIFPILFEKNFLAAPTMMCKKECFDKVGGFNESIYYCQDYDMWLRILKFYDIHVLDQALIKYRWHGGNLTYVKSERADFERAVLLNKAIKNLNISDIFPRLKGLKKISHGPLYATAYRDLAHHLIKSGLIEVTPAAYSFLEEAQKLAPSLEIVMEMEKLVSEHPHFIDLRDQRLDLLSREGSELRVKLNRLQKLHEDLAEKPRILAKKEGEVEKQRQEYLQKEGEAEKQRQEYLQKEGEAEKQRQEYLQKEGEAEKQRQEYLQKEGELEKRWNFLQKEVELEKKKQENLQKEEELEKRREFLQREEELKRKSQAFLEREEELEKKSREWQQKEEGLQKRTDAIHKEIEQRTGKIEEQEKELTHRTLGLDEREQFLHRWQSELLAAQRKWDDFVRKPWNRTLRLAHKVLKAAWSVLPEGMKGPIRTRLKERLFPHPSQTQEIPIEPLVRPQVESGVKPDLPAVCQRPERSRLGLLSQVKQPKVSVVLPVYNQSYLVEASIRSVLDQTYPNLELIIVNDGSTDRMSEILARYAFHDQVTILNQENQRLPRALTNGFKHASGTFFTWTSADNMMLPRQVETLVEFLMKRPDVDMVFSNVEIIDETGAPALNTHYRRHNQCPPGSNRIFLPHEVETLGTVEDNFVNASFLYRSSVGKAIGEYDPCLLGTEDYDYWLRINSLFSLRHLDSDEVLYRYRVHADSLSERFGKSDIFENAKTLIRYHRERESYYNGKFDVVILGYQNHGREGRIEHLALEFRDQGHQVIRVTLDSEKTGDPRRKDGMLEIFLEKRELLKVKENISKHRQHPKALILLMAPLARKILESMRAEDTFICLDLKGSDLSETVSLEPVDAVSSKSQLLLKRLGESLKDKSHLIEDGISEKRILKKARDNFYRPSGDSVNPRRVLLYYGPLRKESFDRDLFDEFVRNGKDWRVFLVGTPGQVDEDWVARLSDPDKVRFLGEKHEDEKENLYQILSEVTALWAPIRSPLQPEDPHEESIQRMIAIAAFSGRPILVPEGLDFSEVPFVFQFKDAKGCADLLERLDLLDIDQEIFDRWIARNTWKEKARWLIGIANNRLYYRKTREPIKKDRKLFPIAPSVCRPDERKTNVAIQVKSLDKGGLEEVVLNLLSHFDYRRINALILCEEKGGHIADRCKDLGIMVKVLGGEKEREYQEILRKYSIGVVNPHYATFGMKIAHEMGIPVVPVLHNTYVWFDDQEIAHFKSCDPYVSRYIAVSENVARYTVGKFGIPPEKIEVISNGLDVLKHQAMMEKGKVLSRANLGIGEGDFLFLNIASYDGRKGHHALISALQRVRKEQSGLKVLCVGNIADPGFHARLKERISKEGLGNDIFLHDFVEDVSSLYPIADAFILPSLIEGWSISVMEAMFYGLPLILTDVGSNGEILRKNGNGILVPTSYGDILNLDSHHLGRYCSEEDPRNVEPLAQAMLDFHSRRDYWRERGQRGKEAVRNSYRIEDVAKAYEEVFLQTAQKRSKDPAIS